LNLTPSRFRINRLRRIPFVWAGFSMVLVLASACAEFTPFEGSTVAAEHFNKAEALFDEGRYPEAIKEYRYVTTQFPDDPLADDALYKSAYTQIYFKNSTSDFGAAVKGFQKLIQKYPDSSWKAPAQNWLSFLAQMDSLKTEGDKLKSDLQRLLDLDMKSEKKRRELK
jgi:outer membrane protein assembly factor BamD (BamD/ComL family)